MRSEYLPAETFCCVCGFIIKEHQIKGNMEGVITYVEHDTQGRVVKVDPLDAYLCSECLNQIVTHTKGGLPMARRKTYELKRLGGDEMGKQSPP
jgi:uncharacterized protein YlaI